jgi:zinc transport system substrate-binding protein
MKMVFMTSRGRAYALTAAVASLALGLCGCGGNAATGATASAPETVDVVVAFYPFQFVAERVAGPHASVANLTQPGSEPHDLELTARQTAAIATADLVIYERSFQPAVDEAVAQSSNERVLDTTTVVPLQAADPHVWLDPANLAAIAGAVAGLLSAADPSHAADYAANAETLVRDLTTLGADLDAGLAHCTRTEFITTHAAFGYLAGRVGYRQIGISGLSPDAEPSPARVAEVQREAREHGITTIFYETLVSPAVAESIAGDLGLVTNVLDPIEGITESSRGSDYLAVMRSNLAALRTANECS